MTEIERTKQMRVLRRQMLEFFSLEELKALAFDLSIDWDTLPGGEKSTKVQSLIMYQVRRDGVEDLIALLREERPSENWSGEAIMQIKHGIQGHAVSGDYELGRDPDFEAAPSYPAADNVEAQLEKAIRVPRAYTRKGALSTSEPTYQFEVILHLHVQIVDRELFGSLADLERAVDDLWTGIVRKILARESRKYTYRELVMAADALDQALEEGNFDAYGLSVVNASAELSLGTTAAEAAREDKKVDRDIEIDIRRQEHFLRMALQDRAGAVAMAVARGEMSVREALSYFDERELQAYQLPIDTLDRLKGLDVLDPDEQAAAARKILGQSLSDSSAKSMPGAVSQLNLQEILRLLRGAEFNPPNPHALPESSMMDSSPEEGE